MFNKLQKFTILQGGEAAAPPLRACYGLFCSVSRFLHNAHQYSLSLNIPMLISPTVQCALFIPLLGEAIIGKNHHFVTFDKQHYSFQSCYSYLLAKDFVRNDFTLILKYKNKKHTIGLFFGPYTVEIDLDSDVSLYNFSYLLENTFYT